MNVDVVESTDHPERLVCRAARGDYYDGYVGDTNYEDLMEPVNYDNSDQSAAAKRLGSELDSPRTVVEAKTKAFIEKQLSRGHYGPWEHPQITFSVEGVSRVTMAQITRHRLMSFDVQSMRYVDFSEKDPIIPKSLKDPDHFTRETGEIELDERRQNYWEGKYENHVREAIARYEDMVEEGVPKEDARFILPLGMPVNMTFSGNARTMLHILDMRRKANAQWEVRELSDKMLDYLRSWMPYTFEWYEEHGPNKLAP